MFKNTLKLASPLLLLVAFGANAQQYTTNEFIKWIGKNQKGHYIDQSTSASCYSNSGGSCPTISLSTGKSSCVSRGFSIDAGIGYDLTKPISNMSISGGASYNQSWSACNTRSESIACTPKVGYKGFAAILFSERWGTQRWTMGKSYQKAGSGGCAAGYKGYELASKGGTVTRCTFSTPINKDGYLPEYRTAVCAYSKL